MVWDTHTVSLDPGLATSPSSVMHYFCTINLTQKSYKKQWDLENFHSNIINANFISVIAG